MTDSEIRKLCADAMGIPMITGGSIWSQDYDPLHDDAQAMALVKKYRVQLTDNHKTSWTVHSAYGSIASHGENLNRAICECVAKLKDEK